LRAFSAKKLETVATWAAGPGFHISRLWRWEPEFFTQSLPLAVLTLSEYRQRFGP